MRPYGRTLRALLFAARALAVTIAASASGGASRADFIVEPGWDLFQTLPGTDFMGIPLVGVPLNAFDFTTGTGGDFGRGIGTRPTGNADTIIKRLAVATGPVATVPTELVGLQLRTEMPVDL